MAGVRHPADSPWNYGLDARPVEAGGGSRRSSGFKCDRTTGFYAQDACSIIAQARRIPAGPSTAAAVNEVAPGPFKSNEPLEDITLIPMGCCRLRITAFPRHRQRQRQGLAAAAEAEVPGERVALLRGDTVDALCDDVVPKNSNDHGIDRFTWWPHKGSAEWVQYDFDKPMTVSSAASTGSTTPSTNGGCKLPKSWRLLYKDGKDWKPVAEPSAYPVPGTSSAR